MLDTANTDDAEGRARVDQPERAPTAPPSRRPGQRRTRRWTRTGTATPFRTRPGGRGDAVGWSWELRREGPEHRRIDVEISPGPYLVTDLPAEARNAIRSRGATAVDAFLEEDNPPVRLAVSTQGIEAHYGSLRPTATE